MASPVSEWNHVLHMPNRLKVRVDCGKSTQGREEPFFLSGTNAFLTRIVVLPPLTGKQTIKNVNITGHLVNEIVKRRVVEAKCPFASEMTAHSLRSGVATEAYIKGASLAQIKEHGRWKDMKTVMGYIQVGRQFSDSALNVF